MRRIFLLSPAHLGGKRAAMLMRDGAMFELARQVQIGAATIGDVFAFCSGLYFRGKLAYARRFANPPTGVPGVQIITSSRGLLPAETFVGSAELSEFARISVDSSEPLFTKPLRATALALASAEFCEIILLGSIATGKYTDTLLPVFGERLRYPSEFAGRGDMSRGALLLRATAANEELRYKMVQSRPEGIRPARREARLLIKRSLEFNNPTSAPQSRGAKKWGTQSSK